MLHLNFPCETLSEVHTTKSKPGHFPRFNVCFALKGMHMSQAYRAVMGKHCVDKCKATREWKSEKKKP